MTARKATRKSWKTLPLPERRARLTLERRFDADEWRRIRRGFVPEEMEDKWFVFEERGRLYFHRSWTGFCVYEVVLRKIPSGAEIVEAWANRDPSQHSETNDARDGLILAFLVDELLLGRRGVWPSRGSARRRRRSWKRLSREGGRAAQRDRMGLMSSTRASDQLGVILSRVAKGERVVLRSGRKAVAAIVPLRDLKVLEARRTRSVKPTPSEIAEVRKARAERGSVSAESLFRELGV